jgi:pimeloyl-ACP methyl ester carboxylesterase/chitodextrinase
MALSVRRSVAIALGFVLLSLTLPGGELVSAQETPDQPNDAPVAAPAMATAAVGETRRFVDQEGHEVMAVEDGFDLDQYLYRSSSPLDFAIDVEADLGPLDSQGHPAPGSPLYGAIASLTIRAWDVDEAGATGVQPERDLIVVNGNVLEGKYLHGANNQWRLTTVLFPTFLLSLRNGQNPSGTNQFQILIDSLNSTNTWAVEVDRVELRLGIDPSAGRPTAMLHGIWGDASHMDAFKSYFETNGDGLAGRIVAPTMTHDDDIDSNLALAEPVINGILDTTGADQVNLVASSLGGFTARKYAATHPDRVSSVVMLGTPNGGTKFADTICAFLNQPIYGDLLRASPLPPEAKRCDEGSAVFQLQRSYVRDTFNVAVRDVLTVFYLTMSGDIDPQSVEDYGSFYFFASKIEEKPNDGLVAVSSVEYLRPDDPDHPGLHIPHAHYPLSHSDLVRNGSQAITDTFCILYPADDDCAVPAAATPSANSALLAENEMEIVQPLSVVIPAGGSADLQLAFEATTTAQITAFTGDPTVTATFGGSALPASSFFDVPVRQAVINNPVDGPLRLSNPTTSTKSVLVLVSIASARRLAITSSPGLALVGQSVTVLVTLDGSYPGETPSAFVMDESGTATTLSLNPLGPGQWSAQYTPMIPGFLRLSASSVEPGSRFASAVTSVSGGRATIGSGFTEQLLGTEDGLADQLLISVPISVQSAGTYRLAADLLATDGSTVGTANAVAPLGTGSHSIDLAFAGRPIFDSAVSGPYRLANVTLSNEGSSMLIEDQRADLGLTNPYDYRAFQHFAILFDQSSFSDQLADVTGDGVLDIVVTGDASVEEAGQYALNAGLRSPDGTEVSSFGGTPSLTAGSNALSIVFNGANIGLSGKDGPYDVVDLSLYPLSDASAFGYLIDAYRTPAYTATQFGTDTTAPTVPVAVVATAASSDRVEIRWSRSSDNVAVNRYTIARDGTDLAIVDGTATSFVDRSTRPTTAYTYTVRAADASGNVSAVSSSAAATTPTCTCAIAIARPTSDVSNNGFTPNAGSTRYTQLDETTSDGDGTYIKGPSSGTANTVIGLGPVPPGTVYQVTVTYAARQFVSAGQPGTMNVHAELWNGTTLLGTGATRNLTTSYQTYNDTFAVNVSAPTIRVKLVQDSAGTNKRTSRFTWVQASLSYLAPDTVAPAVPSALDVEGVCSTRISLSWNEVSDNAGVQGYRVYRNGTPIANLLAGATGPYRRFDFNTDGQGFVASGNVESGSSGALTGQADGPGPWQQQWSWVGTWGSLGVPVGASISSIQLTRLDMTAQVQAVQGWELSLGTVSVVDSSGNTLGNLYPGLSLPNGVYPALSAGPQSALAITAGAGDALRLDIWSGIDSIDVYSSWTFDNLEVRVAWANVTNRIRITDTALAPNTDYQYAVAAVDAAGNSSAQSSPLAVRTSVSGCGG